MKTITQKLLQKLATIIVTLLLYGVIVVLQMPKHARASDIVFLPHAGGAAVSTITRI